MKVTQRQGQILAAIVKEYSQSGDPVGSEELVKGYHFAVSPATIRNEMQALEQAEFLSHPHTSAGRIPTDKGYRYFVNRLMDHLKLNHTEQERLRLELIKLQYQHAELGRGLSRLLSRMSQGGAFALLPGGQTAVSGLAQVLEQDLPQTAFKAVVQFFDELETKGPALMKKDFNHVKAYIGREVADILGPDCSLILSRVRLPSGKSGMIGIVGSKRMKYAKNISLLEYVSKLISSGSAAIIIYNLQSIIQNQ